MGGTISFGNVTSWGGKTASLEAWFDYVSAAIRADGAELSNNLIDLFGESSRSDMETVAHLTVKDVSQSDYEFLKQATIRLIVEVPESIPLWAPDSRSLFVYDACRLLCALAQAQVLLR